MDTLIYGLAGVGIPLLLLPIIMSFRAGISINAVNAQLIRLAADNLDQAIKLCAALQYSPYVSIAKRMLIAAGEVSGPARAERAMAVFHPACAEVQARHRLPRILALVAGSAGLIALLLAIVLGKTAAMMFVLSGADIVVSVWAIRMLSVRGISQAASALAAALRATATPPNSS